MWQRICRNAGDRSATEMTQQAIVWLVLVGATTSAWCAETPSLLGKWRVEKVVYGGQDVPGLAGTFTTFEPGGGKTFELGAGKVEKGTYRLIAGTPQQIDTTTEGKPGKQKGIYRFEEDRVTLVFSQSSGKRPTKFTFQVGTDQLLMSLVRVKATPARAQSMATPDARHFYMGFTAFPHDITPEAALATQAFVKAHADMIAHHIEGVPWEAMHANQPLPDALLDELRGKQAMTPGKAKIFLALSPGRGELKGHDKAPSIPQALRGMPYSHELVKEAYLRYCQKMVEFFRPDYLAIGIEVNEIYDDRRPERWREYLELHQFVYKAIKLEHPQLPICASVTLHTLLNRQGGMVKACEGLMPWSDLVAVSYYPFFVEGDRRESAFEWLFSQFDRYQKPYAMAETNDCAEPTTFDRYTITGDEQSQAAYYQELFRIAEQRRFVYVIAFVHRDYDLLWQKIERGAPQLFKAWMNCGLLDEQGTARPALEIWKAYFEAPRRDP